MFSCISWVLPPIPRYRAGLSASDRWSVATIAPPRSTLTMTNNKLEPDYGRPNQRMAKAVRDAQKLFHMQAPDEAIALLKQNDIPLPVVERVILRRGPSRRRAPPSV